MIEEELSDLDRRVRDDLGRVSPRLDNDGIGGEVPDLLSDFVWMHHVYIR